MIVPYWGELFVSPAPLEMTLNHCSHACAYCFANLNDPQRRATHDLVWPKSRAATECYPGFS